MGAGASRATPRTRLKPLAPGVPLAPSSMNTVAYFSVDTGTEFWERDYRLETAPTAVRSAVEWPCGSSIVGSGTSCPLTSGCSGRSRRALTVRHIALAPLNRYPLACAVEGGAFLQVRVLPRQLAVQPRSYGWTVSGNRGRRATRTKALLGGPANPRAATRVNPEQAPKCSRECRPDANAGKAAASGAETTAKAPDDSPG